LSLKILYFDEMNGFAKSKVMAALWVGMPVISLLMHYLQLDGEGIPLAMLVALVIATMGGALSTVMLSTTIISEKLLHVYDLFLVRPVKRWTLLIAKYLAVFTCLIVAVVISIGSGLAIDAFTSVIPLADIWRSTLESLVVSLAAIAISSAMGVLLGVTVNSVAAGAILSIYCGAQLSAVLMMPSILIEELDPVLYSIPVGIIVTIIVLFIAITLFNKKQF
jgi:ABC-2 type transport system permease protein